MAPATLGGGGKETGIESRRWTVTCFKTVIVPTIPAPKKFSLLVLVYTDQGISQPAVDRGRGLEPLAISSLYVSGKMAEHHRPGRAEIQT